MGLTTALAVGFLLFPVGPGFSDQPSLEALAAASGRPRECGSGTAKGRTRKPTVWRRARVPQLVVYCDLVAKAQIAIETDAKTALELATKADEAWTGHAGAMIAQGRALLALGKSKEALEKFEKAKEIDKLSVEEPKAMRAHARALVLNDRLADGAELYRTMVPRSSLMPERHRTRLLLEAAFASMSDAASPARARAATGASARPMGEALSEAIAFISEARSSEGGPLAGDILLAAALIHDRAGDGEKARALLAEAARTKAKPNDPVSYVSDPADSSALTALSLEPTSASEAADTWTSFAGATKVDSFASSARARAAALRGGKVTSPKKKTKKKEP